MGRVSARPFFNMKQIVDTTESGIVSSLIYNSSGEAEGYLIEDDVEAVIEHNKIRKAANPSGDWVGKDGRVLGSIPLSIAELWKHKLGVDVYNHEHLPLVKKLLRDPEWSAFRLTDKQF